MQPMSDAVPFTATSKQKMTWRAKSALSFSTISSVRLSLPAPHIIFPICRKTRITHILYHLRDKREYYLGIINYDDGTLFLGFFRDYMLQNVSIKMSGSYDEYSQRVPEDFLINSLTSSFVGMIRWWLKNKMHPGPEVVAGYYMALINPAIAEFQTKGE